MSAHYRFGNIQPIEAITEWGLGYNAGTAIAYIARHEHKDDAAGDLRKAIWHLCYELTENTELCDTIVSDVEVATVVDWVPEVEQITDNEAEYGVIPGAGYIDCGMRYVVRTDGWTHFDSDDYLEADKEFTKVANKFNCDHAQLLDRGPLSLESNARCVREWIWEGEK